MSQDGRMASKSTLGALRGASLGAVAWSNPGRRGGGDEAVRVRGVLPLVGRDGPVLALPYADVGAARSLGTAREALLVTQDARGTTSAYRPLTLRCRPHLVEDREGEIFVADFLDQELRRYPPSRLLADSIILRRENWWWLPRLLVHLEVLAEEPPIQRRDENDHLLVVDAGTTDPGRRLVAASARLSALGDPLRSPEFEIAEGPPGPGPAVLFGQDASFPDLERWARWTWTGRWDGERLEVVHTPTRAGLPPVPGILTRWRRHRALQRACVSGLDDAG